MAPSKKECARVAKDARAAKWKASGDGIRIGRGNNNNKVVTEVEIAKKKEDSSDENGEDGDDDNATKRGRQCPQ
eukprot:scaffold10661_cov50-Attheya_sp.AAC.2